MLSSPLYLLRDNPLLFVAFVLAVIVAITFHEFSHAAAGTLQGDDTAKSQGRLTLNPLSHLDPLGSIFLIVGGFGWGRPTPYNPARLRNQRVGTVLVALAGPTSNFLLAIASAVALRVALSAGSDASSFTVNLLLIFIQFNVLLGIFNLLPIPPLDGSRLLTVFLPPSRHGIVDFLDRYGIFLLLGLLILAPGLLTPFVAELVRAILGLVGLPY
ncbi:MAG TPA: site-2 protease family protein [Actinomycetes bacterium]|nr:site-2 protease family protein [Actinomycetes bacterium]